MVLLYAILSALIVSTSNAFTPSNFGYRTPQIKLHAKTLEGWKIQGNIKPTNNFILIKLADVQEVTDTGILLSESAKVKKTEGSVVSVGPGKTHPDTGLFYPMPVEEGDSVIYGEYDGTEIKIDGVRHCLIRDNDILIKFRGGEGSLSLDTVQAVNDSVLVAVKTAENETSGGLFLADTNEHKRPSTGEVVKVGPGKMSATGELISAALNIGDIVKFQSRAGDEVKIGEVDYSIVRMGDVFAKF